MNKFVGITLILLLISYSVFSQSQVNSGKSSIEIFTDFHYNINDTAKTTGFGLNRAYLGYNYIAEGNISAQITVNVGNPEDIAGGSTPKRYAYFREASVNYTGKN